MTPRRRKSRRARRARQRDAHRFAGIARGTSLRFFAAGGTASDTRALEWVCYDEAVDLDDEKLEAIREALKSG
jgi:hypothetical protein